ncbi:flagellar assembly factor FliW [Compostibacillus humi]|uniref:Flagellar assembly factor FliW n=1 Tax=Compostibacillus humi TaxID=1245525 RepID=A0A8J3EJU8_9BACI|nr:flagellar assembly factor FliW [Compostibacillus humi]
MEIMTKYFGKVSIEEGKIIEFPDGIPGFIEERRFVLLDLPANPAFQILQSVHNAHTAFVVTNPYFIYPDYTFKLDEAVQEQLQIREEKDVTVLSIVTLKQPFQQSTLNLKAPLIINPIRMLGKQYILNLDDYSSKAPISPAPLKKGVK